MDPSETNSRAPIDDLLTEVELAEFVKLSVSVVQKWRVLGKGPAFIKIDDGGTVRYRRSEIERWLTDRTRLATDGSKFLNNIATRSVA